MICKHCDIECERREPHIKKRHILQHNYYYSYRFYCLQCKRYYYPKESIVYYRDEEKIKAISGDQLTPKLKDTYEDWTKKSELKRQGKLIHVFRQYYLDNPQAYYNREEKLAALLYLSTLVFPMKVPLSEQRQAFDTKKQNPIWQRHINAEKCFLCLGLAQVRHHMILLKNGGRNVFNNIITLCRPCHADIHPWLKSLNHQ